MAPPPKKTEHPPQASSICLTVYQFCNTKYSKIDGWIMRKIQQFPLWTLVILAWSASALAEPISRQALFGSITIGISAKEIVTKTGETPILVPEFNRKGYVVSILKHATETYIFLNDQLVMVDIIRNYRINNMRQMPSGLESSLFIIAGSNFQDNFYTSAELVRSGICGMTNSGNIWKTQVIGFQDKNIIFRWVDRDLLTRFCLAYPVDW
jgi:hypothetical protein